MSEKQAKDQTMTGEEFPVAGQEAPQVPDLTPQDNPVKQVTLDAYCRKVTARVPPETLSVFYTIESSNGRVSASFDEFERRLQEFMTAPLG